MTDTLSTIHADRILILDFGSQYTQLIARRVREAGVYCELHPWDMDTRQLRDFGAKGVILSGGPESVHEEETPRASYDVFEGWVRGPETSPLIQTSLRTMLLSRSSRR